MVNKIIDTQVKYTGPFALLLSLLSSKSMHVIETKEEGEKAITVRVPPSIAERLGSLAKASRLSRSYLIVCFSKPPAMPV